MSQDHVIRRPSGLIITRHEHGALVQGSEPEVKWNVRRGRDGRWEAGATKGLIWSGFYSS